MAAVKRTRTTKTTKKSQSAKPAATAAISAAASDVAEVVRRRAYELYEERGRQHGGDFEDWLRAESEVRTRSA